MNYGWAGAGDAWYNKEEVYNSAWTPSFGWAMGNLYRQKLQPNDNLGGQIISGRVTDANGNPVAGVKVSIRKQGEEDIWQTMLVWNEPKDPEATPIYKDWDEKGNNDGTQQEDEIPGADKFRNTTDARGIWAIDKVETGTYEIVLEKDGLNFAGIKTVTVISSRNVWAKDFIASPLENLALESWWIEDGVVYLQFNRATTTTTMMMMMMTTTMMTMTMTTTTIPTRISSMPRRSSPTWVSRSRSVLVLSSTQRLVNWLFTTRRKII